MALLKRTLTHSIKSASSKELYENLTNLEIFGKFHPKMTSVTRLNETSEYSEYLIHEFVWLFGFLPLRPVYKSRVFEIEKNKRVRYTALINGRIDLTIDFEIADSNNQRLITEQIRIEGNSIIAKILMSLILKSHNVLFERMNFEFVAAA